MEWQPALTAGRRKGLDRTRMQTLDPREVEKPFHWRWLKGALLLMLRSPLRFGALIAVLAFIDTSAVKHLQSSALPQVWFDWLGLACLPVLWTLVSALARGADDSSQTWPALRDFARNLAWYRALLAGILTISLISLLSFVLKKEFRGIFAPLPGEVLRSFAAQCWACWAAYGLCYFPLLVFLPGLSGWRLLMLAKKAEALNEDNKVLPIWIVLWLANIAALFIEELLPYGIVAAAWLVYSGIVSYVAYKDIFERRPLNLVEPAAGTADEQPPERTAPAEAQ